MRFAQVSRSQKMKVLHELVNGRTTQLRCLYDSRERDFSKMTDTELIAEHERIRKRVFRETGIMPPPLPDFGAMTYKELQNHIIERRHAIADQSRKD